MKKLLLSLIGLFLWYTGSSQACLPQGITFSTQNQIDNFHTNYPNCTIIFGNVTISGANITNLNGLNGLTAIDANFTITNDSVLPNLSGLDSLTYIGGALEINWNHNLSSLTGLNKITEIGGYLDITGNNNLTSLTALHNLASINGYLQVDLNNVLDNLTGLDNINDKSITTLKIYNNDSLSNCTAHSVCFYFLTGRNVQIYNNKTGCNSPDEVVDECFQLNVENITDDKAFSIYPNPATDKITVEQPGLTQSGNLTIVNIDGLELITRQITEPKTHLDISNLPSGVYFVRLTNDKTVEVGKFVKQ